MQELWLIVVYFQGTMLSSSWWRKILNSFLNEHSTKQNLCFFLLSSWEDFQSNKWILYLGYFQWLFTELCFMSWTLFRRTELCFAELNSVSQNWTLFRRAELSFEELNSVLKSWTLFTELSSVHSNNITELFALLSTDKFRLNIFCLMILVPPSGRRAPWGRRWP